MDEVPGQQKPAVVYKKNLKILFKGLKARWEL